MQIILASASARREKILRSLGLDFKVVPSQLKEEEFKQKIKNPKKLTLALALAKAKEVKDKIKLKEFLIIAADTFVVLEDMILGKPKTRREAEKMLWQLSGKAHQVLTGLVLLDNQNKMKRKVIVSWVEFNQLTDQKIKEYLNTGLFLDRAGAYGIQDPKCNFVKSTKGSYTNIVGLPVGVLKKYLKDFGLKGVMNNGK